MRDQYRRVLRDERADGAGGRDYVLGLDSEDGLAAGGVAGSGLEGERVEIWTRRRVRGCQYRGGWVMTLVLGEGEGRENMVEEGVVVGV